MIPPDRLVLLDTNVLVHLARGKAAGRWIDAQYHLRNRSERPLISIVTVGEIRRIALRNAWGPKKMQFAEQLVTELVVVDIDDDILHRYAQIGSRLAKGRTIGDNDVWIGATASAKGAILLTTDRDFDSLPPDDIERVFIDPAQLPREE